jgi:sugar phosphate permease
MKVRWRICFLLFLTWVLSYIDRSLMPMAIPFIGKEFHLQPAVMGVVLSAFFVGYAVTQIPGGMIADRLGPRKTIALGVAAWSVFSIVTGLAGSVAQLIGIRVAFGLGEGVHPPASFKAISAWFKTEERARANGLVLSSNTIGPMVAPLLFTVLMTAFGWRKAFFVISAPGFAIALAVYWYLRDRPAEHSRITPEEISEIGEESAGQRAISFSEMLRYQALWRLFFIYTMWDVTWWGFQAWLPAYLLNRGFTVLKTGAVAALPFAAGFVGILVVAHIADKTRKRRAILAAVLGGNALSMLLIPAAPNAAWAIAFLMTAGFFLPAIHGPFWSLPMDLLPSKVIGCASGFINTGGQIAGIAAPVIMGGLIQSTGRYEAGFLFLAASASLSGLLVATLRASPQRIQDGTPVLSEARARSMNG